MTVSSNAARDTSEREFIVTRIFDAPRELVWKVWTDPVHRVRWLGPRGFTGISVEMDLRPGGTYRTHMRGSEGQDRWQRGVFREIVEPERLVMTYVWTDEEGNATLPETLVTVTLAEHEGKTRVALKHEFFETVAARDAHRDGWASALDRLAEYLMQA